MKPTDEQVKWFWEQCGFEVITSVRLKYPNSMMMDRIENIPIDLNNLFQYAVPKLGEYDRLEVLMSWAYDCVALEEDAALALFWAIYKAFGSKE